MCAQIQMQLNPEVQNAYILGEVRQQTSYEERALCNSVQKET
jgi:hypothetical protein